MCSWTAWVEGRDKAEEPRHAGTPLSESRHTSSSRPEGASGSNGLKQSVSNLVQDLRALPAVEIDSLRRDSNFLSQIEQCESALKTIRKMMSRG